MAVTITTDSFIAASANGQYQSMQFGSITVNTAPTVAGTVSSRRTNAVFSVAPVGGGVSNAILTTAGIDTYSAGNIIAKEIDFGTYTFGTGWSGTGNTMPSVSIQGSSIQTCATLFVLAIATTATATTPLITVTYTNQAGTASQSMTYTLPTNAATTSAYILNPYLASGDLGVRAVSNVTSSAGSSGTFHLYGCLPLFLDAGPGVQAVNQPLVQPNPIYQLVGGDQIGFYQLGNSGNNNPVMFGFNAVGA